MTIIYNKKIYILNCTHGLKYELTKGNLFTKIMLIHVILGLNSLNKVLSSFFVDERNMVGRREISLKIVIHLGFLTKTNH